MPGPRRRGRSRRCHAATCSAGRGCSRPTAGTSTPARRGAVARDRLRRRLPARQVRGRPALGYALMQRVRRRSSSSGCRPPGSGCSTCYGHVPGAADPRRRAGAMVPAALPRCAAVRRRETPTTPWTRRRSSSRARGDRRRFAPGPVRHALRVRRRRGADLGQRRPSARRTARAHHPRGRRGHRARCAPRGRGDVLGVRGPFGTGWPVEPRPGGDVVVVAGGIGLAPLRPAIARRCSPTARATAGSSCSTAARSPAEDLLYRDELGALGARARRRGRGHRRPGGRGWPGAVGVVTTLDRRAALRPGRTVALVCGPEVMMRFAAAALRDAASPPSAIRAVAGAQHAVRRRAVRALPARRRCSSAATARCSATTGVAPLTRGCGSCRRRRSPSSAVWKFASCDGCQLTLLDCEDELLALAGRGRDRLLPGGHQRGRRGPVRRVARRGLDHHAGGRRAHPAGPRDVAARW